MTHAPTLTTALTTAFFEIHRYGEEHDHFEWAGLNSCDAWQCDRAMPTLERCLNDAVESLAPHCHVLSPQYCLEIALTIPLPDTSPYRCGEHFDILFVEGSYFMWRGAGPYQNMQSEHQYTEIRETVCDAMFNLHQALQYSCAEALQLVMSLGLYDACNPTVQVSEIAHIRLGYTDIKAGQHYELYDYGHVVHWRAVGSFGGTGLGSQEEGEIGGFEDGAGAADEACETLALCSKYGVEEAAERMNEFKLMLACLWPRDRDAIHDAVQPLPLNDRFESAFVMVKRTEPMPEQYWHRGL